MVGWPESSKAAADLMEEMVYTVQWDNRFKDAIRSRFKVTDFMAYDSVEDSLSHVKALLLQEQAEATAASGTPASSTCRR